MEATKQSTTAVTAVTNWKNWENWENGKNLPKGIGSMSVLNGHVAANKVDKPVAAQNASINNLPGIWVKKKPLVLAENTVKKSDKEIFK